MRKIREIIVHCSASEWGDNLIINEWHKARGWEGIGYHFVILNGRTKSRHTYISVFDGAIVPGRGVEEVGAHAKGHNAFSVGVCLIGDEKFTVSQLESLKKVVNWVKDRFGNVKVLAHYEVNRHKTCPNIVADALRSYLAGTLSVYALLESYVGSEKVLEDKKRREI